ncbi:hypothetical protein M413DRAFT_439078 [Hebeloma cylindrosporum]|uniref:Protein kinase domain-containing protein n=1 Tax=Hebeloma cylindrosporum TaxID=76867 RepID=A0A0C2Z2E1_HEBCY|nr:hypothetical protein M413DRAFT_439078 [Hebeloma cylindrosporum h7]
MSTVECPLFQKADDWDVLDTDDDHAFHQHILRVAKCWTFLKPYFSSHGYTLYCGVHRDPWDTLAEPLPKAAENPQHPYGRRAYKTDKDGLFGVRCGRVWAARDDRGHDVVIKLICNSDNPTNEYKILQYLNEEGVRADPRNHTIPVLEFLTVKDYIFAIMPRWDEAFLADFGTVVELMHCFEQLLECFEFLHEHRIFHGDFQDQNAGLNIVAHSYKYFALGLRDPAVARYAVYDFGNSQRYSRNVSVRDFRATPWYNFQNVLRIKAPTGAFNPFALDVLSFALVLQRRVRHIENIIPAIGPYFDRLILTDDAERPTAHEALVEFRQILSQTTSSQLSEKVTTLFWEDGKVVAKMTINSIY